MWKYRVTAVAISSAADQIMRKPVKYDVESVNYYVVWSYNNKWHLFLSYVLCTYITYTFTVFVYFWDFFVESKFKDKTF